jgi:chromosome segregation ATPase
VSGAGRTQLDATAVELRGCEARVRELEELVKTLAPEAERLRAALRAEQARADALAAAAEAAVPRTEREAAQARAGRAEQEKAAGEKELARLRTKLAAAEKARAEAQAARDALAARAEALVPRAELAPLEDSLRATRDQARPCPPSPLRSLRGLVAAACAPAQRHWKSCVRRLVSLID